MHSFISPRKKPLYSKMTLMWFVFVGCITLALLSFGGILNYKASQMQGKIEALKLSTPLLRKSVSEDEKELRVLKMQNRLVEEVQGSNSLLKNKIKDLFDLVPEQIVLDKVVMQWDLLVLEGTTFTKDSYRLLLEPALKSIFDSSKVTYHFNERIGKYEFKSVNHEAVADSEGENNVSQ